MNDARAGRASGLELGDSFGLRSFGFVIPPGGRLGILGGGQLARMTALAARRMGYRVHVFEHPDADASAAPVCEEVFRAPFDDAAALARFAAGVDVVTLEFENIPADALRAAADHGPVRPGPEVLEICQHREREKRFLERHGFPHAPFRVVASLEELHGAVAAIGLPAALKSAAGGYDGKGQARLTPGAGVAEVWRAWSAGVPGARGVLEGWVDFAAELSVICARNGRGEMRSFPVFENEHARHILDVTIFPGRFPPEVARRATELAEAVTAALRVEGLLAVEMFLTRGGEVLVNELAPRPHNSGHVTLDAGLTSQFEQHVRAVCGLPLGDPAPLRPAVMVNLLGDLWPTAAGGEGGAPDWTPVLREPAAKLHLYGKQRARPGRKMGHFTVLGTDVETTLAKARAIQAELSR